MENSLLAPLLRQVKKGGPAPHEADSGFAALGSKDRSLERVNIAFTARPGTASWRFVRMRGRSGEDRGAGLFIELAADAGADLIRPALLAGRRVNVRCGPGEEYRLEGLKPLVREARPVWAAWVAGGRLRVWDRCHGWRSA